MTEGVGRAFEIPTRLPRSRPTLMVGEDFRDRALGAGDERRILALVVGVGDQADGECPALPSRPRCIINTSRRPKDIAQPCRQEVPGDDQIEDRDFNGAF